MIYLKDGDKKESDLMIEIKNLTVKYNDRNNEVTALNNINISIKKGDIYVFIGPSGCVKSTLLHVLSGIIKDYRGSVLLGNGEIDVRKQIIGLVQQNYGLLPWKTVYNNIILGAKIKCSQDKSRDINEDELYAEKIMNELNIQHLKNRYPGEISGGQKQRAAIARALVLKPDILLMDEPFSALDAITRENLQNLFLNIWKKYKITTVFITHSVEEALYLGKHIIIMSSSPGIIIENVENPLFCMENVMENEKYYKIAGKIRSTLKRGMNNENQS